MTVQIREAADLAPALSAGMERFNELMREHRTHNAVRFFETEQRARQWLTYNPVVKC